MLVASAAAAAVVSTAARDPAAAAAEMMWLVVATAAAVAAAAWLMPLFDCSPLGCLQPHCHCYLPPPPPIGGGVPTLRVLWLQARWFVQRLLHRCPQGESHHAADGAAAEVTEASPMASQKEVLLNCSCLRTQCAPAYCIVAAADVCTAAAHDDVAKSP